MSEWRSMKTAPRDGSWLILEVETGGHLFEPRVGRWKPHHFAGLGTYEWEIVDRRAGGLDEAVPPSEIFSNYADGRVSGWLPLPHNKDRQE